jgi:putative flippase GtrA
MTKEKQTKKQLFGEMFRFMLVGGISTVVDYFIFWLVDGVLFPWMVPNANEAQKTLFLVLATALGFCFGLIVNWKLSLSFVFRNVQDKEKASSHKSFALFTAIGICGLILTEIGMIILVAVLPEFSLFGVTTLLGTTWAKGLSKAIMTILVMVFNYVLRKIFIFK